MENYEIDNNKNKNKQEFDIFEDNNEELLLMEKEIPKIYRNKEKILCCSIEEIKDKFIKIENTILCQICKLNQFKYTCPACLIKTCSIPCINNHKRIKKCSGKKPNYNSNISTEKDLKKDINYLSEMINKSNNVSKWSYNTFYDKHQDTENLLDYESLVNRDKKLKVFSKLCKKFRNVNYERSSIYLKSFRYNNCFCDSKLKKFYWTVKLFFLNDNSMNPNICSHIIGKVFDDSITSLDCVLNYIINHRQEVQDFDTLTCVNHLIEKSKKTEISFYYRISKIDYTNYILMNKSKRKEDGTNEYNPDVFTLKMLYFQKFNIEEKSKMLIDIIKGKTIKDFIEIYVY